jgi:hypothetical protein
MALSTNMVTTVILAVLFSLPIPFAIRDKSLAGVLSFGLVVLGIIATGILGHFLNRR